MEFWCEGTKYFINVKVSSDLELFSMYNKEL